MEKLKARILKAIKKDRKSGCWNWTRSVDHNGYGRISVDGMQWGAHRASLFAFEPKRFCRALPVLHSCDNPPCVNPSHLYSGTLIQNARDCISRGRRPRGEKHHAAVLGMRDVFEIIWAREMHGTSKATLARAFGVSPRQIGRILSGKSWQ